MLVLTRKPGQSLLIGDVRVTVVRVRWMNGGYRVSLGIDAPREISVRRAEARSKSDGKRRANHRPDARHG